MFSAFPRFIFQPLLKVISNIDARTNSLFFFNKSKLVNFHLSWYLKVLFFFPLGQYLGEFTFPWEGEQRREGLRKVSFPLSSPPPPFPK